MDVDFCCHDVPRAANFNAGASEHAALSWPMVQARASNASEAPNFFERRVRKCEELLNAY